MMNLFAKARNGLNLTPGERATLRLIEGLAVAGLVAALPVLADALSTRGVIVWSDVLHSALAAASTAILMAVLKFAKAQADAPLPVPSVPSDTPPTSDSAGASADSPAR